MTRPMLVIFSDLDGTLLDHRSYHWQPAQPALVRVENAGIPLVLNSSKTASEIRQIRQELGNRAPYIVENGAAAVIPPGTFGNREEDVVNFGASRKEVLGVLVRLRAEGARFQGFEDMSAAALAELTGLDEASACRAKERLGTEPLLWQGSDEELEDFRTALEAENLRLVRGGRFWHAMGNFDKADGARFLLGIYKERFGEQPVIAVALGDSPNDQQMLEMADIPVVIRGVNSDQVQLPATRRAMRSLRPGPEGWNECVLNLLLEYGY